MNFCECCTSETSSPNRFVILGATGNTAFRKCSWLWSIPSSWDWIALRPHHSCVRTELFSTDRLAELSRSTDLTAILPERPCSSPGAVTPRNAASDLLFLGQKSHLTRQQVYNIVHDAAVAPGIPGSNPYPQTFGYLPSCSTWRTAPDGSRLRRAQGFPVHSVLR